MYFKIKIISSNSFIQKLITFISFGEALFKVTKKNLPYQLHGTSDARFIKDICPVYEFGSVGKTMHKVNENINIEDLEKLQKVYEELILSITIILLNYL